MKERIRGTSESSHKSLSMRILSFMYAKWSICFFADPKNHVRRFQLGVVLPWGREFVFETGIGSPRGITPLKYAHPEDPIIDVIYAGTVLPLLEPDGEPLTYFSDYRGLMTTRTGWGRDEVFLYFEPRNVPGGHTRDSRNEFVLAAHGRLWATRTTAVEDASELHSVMLIDGEGQGHQCPQGRTVAVVDKPLATFCVGDARWAYSHAAGSDEDSPVKVTPNESRLKPSPLPWMDKPWSFLPAWNTGIKGGGRHGHWREHNPVRYAYRTAGLVRGEHPYVLIVDDYRKDDKEHLYQWLMQIPNDVQMVERSVGTPGQDQVLDLILGEKVGSRRLLLRVLAAGVQSSKAKPVQTDAKLETYESHDRGNITTYQRISLPLKSVGGHFIVLLYPHHDGELLPTTAWTRASAGLKVVWPDQADNYVLSVGPDGRTRIRLDRQGLDTLAVE